MSKFKQRALIFFTVGLLFFSFMPEVGAMHIMEGYLPLGLCVAWGVISLPFLVVGYRKLVNIHRENPQSITLIAMAAAFIFVLSSLKIPSLTGSSSHMTGTGLGAILFGATPVSVLGLIALVFQAVLLAHGGLTTLGANVFSMAIVGPFVAYGIYFVCKKMNMNKKVAIFLAAMLGDLMTYVVTSGQLAMAYPSETGGMFESFVKFMGVFAPTQVPLAIIEGLLTVAIIVALEAFAKSELKTIGFLREEF